MKKHSIEINKKQFIVFGTAKWMVVPIDAARTTPAGWAIIEEKNLGFALASPNRLKYNCLTAESSNGALIPVLFTGDTGRNQADEIVYIINRKL